jgi:hypothetical protein
MDAIQTVILLQDVHVNNSSGRCSASSAECREICIFRVAYIEDTEASLVFIEGRVFLSMLSGSACDQCICQINA